MKTPETAREALTLALFLGLTAPTDADADAVTEVAEQIARNMTETDVRAAKRNALARFRRHRREAA